MQLGKEKEALLARQFSLDKIKDDSATMLFYTGFPNYEALMSFHNYIELKVRKIQYWKREKLLNESRLIRWIRIKVKQAFKDTHLPSRVCSCLIVIEGRIVCTRSLTDLELARVLFCVFALHG